MPRKKQLKWGQTPFDRMTKKELTRHAQRMYSALSSCMSVIGMQQAMDRFQVAQAKGSDPDALSLDQLHPYWGCDGSGGRALEKARQALVLVDQPYDKEVIYTSFFRYADDLLFDGSQFNVVTGWVVCPKCGTMLGSRLKDSGKNRLEGKACSESGLSQCDGIFRPITWEDLK